MIKIIVLVYLATSIEIAIIFPHLFHPLKKTKTNFNCDSVISVLKN